MKRRSSEYEGGEFEDDGFEMELIESQTKVAEPAEAMAVQTAQLLNQGQAMIEMQKMMTLMGIGNADASLTRSQAAIPIAIQAPSVIVAPTPLTAVPLSTRTRYTRLTFPGLVVPPLPSTLLLSTPSFWCGPVEPWMGPGSLASMLYGLS